MTDEDVIRRVADLFHRAVCVDDDRPDPTYKDVYITTVKGAAAVAWMRCLCPTLGERRRRQVEIATRGPRRPIRWSVGGPCSVTGCSREVAIRGLCRQHYKSWWKSRKRGRPARYVPSDPPSPTGLNGDSLPAVPPDRSASISWLAGLLEGEGTFSSVVTNARAYPRVELSMCDEDVVERAAELLGRVTVRRVVDPRAQDRGWRPVYFAAVGGARAAELMRELRPWMGLRRGRAIDNALASYRPIRLARRKSCIVDGCAARHDSKGLCHRHHMQWWRDVRSGRKPRVTPLR